MRKSLEKFLQYANRGFFSCWIILGVGTLIVGLYTLLTLIGIHYVTSTGWDIIQLVQVTALALGASIIRDLLFSIFRNTIRYSEIKDL